LSLESVPLTCPSLESGSATIPCHGRRPPQSPPDVWACQPSITPMSHLQMVLRRIFSSQRLLVRAKADSLGQIRARLEQSRGVRTPLVFGERLRRVESRERWLESGAECEVRARKGVGLGPPYGNGMVTGPVRPSRRQLGALNMASRALDASYSPGPGICDDR